MFYSNKFFLNLFSWVYVYVNCCHRRRVYKPQGRGLATHFSTFPVCVCLLHCSFPVFQTLCRTAGSKKSTWPVQFYIHSGLREPCADFDPVLATFRSIWLKHYEAYLKPESVKTGRDSRFHWTRLSTVRLSPATRLGGFAAAPVPRGSHRDLSSRRAGTKGSRRPKQRMRRSSSPAFQHISGLRAGVLPIKLGHLHRSRFSC